MEGVSPNMVVGSGTEVVAGEKLVVTAGAIDIHVHFICPQQVVEALAAGTTTMVGGGTGPSAGTCATTCTPSPWDMQMMISATDGMPMNFGFTGKGNDAGPAALEDIVKAGAMGLKLHEDWGSTPAVIKNCLDVGDKYDVQVNIHTDTLNESGFVESRLSGDFSGWCLIAFHLPRYHCCIWWPNNSYVSYRRSRYDFLYLLDGYHLIFAFRGWPRAGYNRRLRSEQRPSFLNQSNKTIHEQHSG